MTGVSSHRSAGDAVQWAAMDLPPLRSRIVARAEIALAPPLEWRPSPAGTRRVIAVAGGRLHGERLSGEILPGGADWQLLAPDGTAFVEARYTVRTDSGELILVESTGVRSGPPEVLAALRRGEAPDPDTYTFRTAVRLEAGPGEHAWVNRSLFVAVAAREPDGVVYDLHELI